MSDCFVLYLLLICMKKEKTGAGKFTNNSLVFKFFYAPKIGTPEGIVISDQLQDESSSAARNIEKAQSQPGGDHEVQALLVVE